MPQKVLLRFEFVARPPLLKSTVVGEPDADPSAVWKLPVAVPTLPAASALRTRKKYVLLAVKPLSDAE